MMLLQFRPIMLPPRHSPVPLRSAAAKRQVTVQAAHLDNGSPNVRSVRPKSTAREAARGYLRSSVESQPGVSGVAVEPKRLSTPLQLDLVASRFKLSLQGASRQVKSRLDGAEAQQDALASRLDILESRWINSLAISFMALNLAIAAGGVLGSLLPGALLGPVMVWAAVSRWVAWGDLTRACTHANWAIETAQAEGLADLEACRSQAMDGLAKPRLHESWRESGGSSGMQARRDSTVKQQQIITEVKGVQKRMEQRLKMLQSRLDQLRARKDRLLAVWFALSVCTLTPVGTVIAALGASVSSGLIDVITYLTPLLFLCLVLPLLMAAVASEK